MVGNQVIASVIGFVPVAGDIGIAIFKANFRNAALLEEYLRIRGEELLKAQADRVEDPVVVKPGAGQEGAEKIPGKLPSQKSFSFFRGPSKKVPVAEGSPAQSKDEPKEKNGTKIGRSEKSKGKQKSR